MRQTEWTAFTASSYADDLRYVGDDLWRVGDGKRDKHDFGKRGLEHGVLLPLTSRLPPARQRRAEEDRRRYG